MESLLAMTETWKGVGYKGLKEAYKTRWANMMNIMIAALPVHIYRDGKYMLYIFTL